VLESAALLPDAIYESLRASIIAQVHSPGETVTESAVALRFGVARPTAKVAIERLVTEGLLRREANAAARIPVLDRDDVVDLYDNRAVIESTATSALAAHGIIPVVALQAQRALEANAVAREPFAEHDIAFHRALVAAQPSPRLTRLHELLMGEIELCIGQVQAGHLIDAKDVAGQHQGILDAILAGNSALAVERTRDHIHGARDALLAHLDSKARS
jgi:DNA-binding GntR family transcriptional regulator